MTQIPDSKTLAERIQAGRLSRFDNRLMYEAPDRTGFFGAIRESFKVGTSGQVYRDVMMPGRVRTDPDWGGIGSLPEGVRKELLDGILPDYYEGFYDANSYEDALNIRRRILMVQNAERKIAEAGVSGMGARLIATALDPVEVGTFAATAGAAFPIQTATKAGKLASFVRAGLVTGATAGALEAYAGQDDPNRGVYEAAFAAMLGGMMGGTIGSFRAGRHNKSLLRTALEKRAGRLERVSDMERFTAISNDIRRLERAMLNEIPHRPITYTPLGEKYFANLNRDMEARRIVAAAEGLGYEADDLRQLQIDIGEGRFDELLEAMGEGPNPDQVYARLYGLTEDEAARIRNQRAQASRTEPSGLSTLDDDLMDLEAGDLDLTARAAEADAFDPRTPDAGNPDLVQDPDLVNEGGITAQGARFGFKKAFTGSRSRTAKVTGDLLVEDAVYNGKRKNPSATFWHEFKRRALTSRWLYDITPAVKQYTGRVIQRGKEMSEFGAKVRTAIISGNPGDPAVAAVAKRTAQLFNDTLMLGKRMGIRGFENVEPRPDYFPRMYNVRKMYDAIHTHGREPVERWFAQAYKKMHPGAGDDTAAKVGRGLVDIVMDSDNVSSLEAMGALSGDRLDILDQYLRNMLDGDQVDAIIHRVRETGKKNADLPGSNASEPRRLTARAKRRTLIDENHVDEATGLKLDDFVETNALDVAQRYVNEVTGAAAETATLRAAGARLGRKFETRSQLFEQVRQELIEAHPPGRERDRAIAYMLGDRGGYGVLEKAFRAASGRSLNPDTTVNEILRDTRLAVHSLFNGAFGAASMPETGIVIAGAFPQFVRLVPELGNIVKAALGLRIPESFIKEAALIHGHHMAGKGIRLAGLHDLSRTVEDTGTMFGRRIRQAAEWSDMLGLLEPVTSVQRTLSTSLAWQKWYDIARGGKPLSAKRLATMKLDEAMSRRIIQNIKAHATGYDGAFGVRLGNMNIHKWEKEVAAAFIFSVESWAGRAVQNVNIGMLAPWMTNEWARLITQYRVFPIAAWENHMLNNIAIRDAQVGQEVLGSMTLAATTYVAQVYRQSAGQKDRKEFLEDRLTPKNIMFAAFSRSGAFSLMPDAIDMVGSMYGAPSLFDYRNSGLSRARLSVNGVLSNPAFATIDSTVRLGKDLIQAGQHAVGDPFGTGSPFTDSDFRNFRKLIPLNRVAGIDNFMRGLERLFPEEKPGK